MTEATSFYRTTHPRTLSASSASSSISLSSLSSSCSYSSARVMRRPNNALCDKKGPGYLNTDARPQVPSSAMNLEPCGEQRAAQETPDSPPSSPLPLTFHMSSNDYFCLGGSNPYHSPQPLSEKDNELSREPRTWECRNESAHISHKKCKAKSDHVRRKHDSLGPEQKATATNPSNKPRFSLSTNVHPRPAIYTIGSTMTPPAKKAARSASTKERTNLKATRTTDAHTHPEPLKPVSTRPSKTRPPTTITTTTMSTTRRIISTVIKESAITTTVVATKGTKTKMESSAQLQTKSSTTVPTSIPKNRTNADLSGISSGSPGSAMVSRELHVSRSNALDRRTRPVCSKNTVLSRKLGMVSTTAGQDITTYKTASTGDFQNSSSIKSSSTTLYEEGQGSLRGSIPDHHDMQDPVHKTSEATSYFVVSSETPQSTDDVPIPAATLPTTPFPTSLNSRPSIICSNGIQKNPDEHIVGTEQPELGSRSPSPSKLFAQSVQEGKKAVRGSSHRLSVRQGSRSSIPDRWHGIQLSTAQEQGGRDPGKGRHELESSQWVGTSTFLQTLPICMPAKFRAFSSAETTPLKTPSPGPYPSAAHLSATFNASQSSLDSIASTTSDHSLNQGPSICDPAPLILGSCDPIIAFQQTAEERPPETLKKQNILDMLPRELSKAPLRNLNDRAAMSDLMMFMRERRLSNFRSEASPTLDTHSNTVHIAEVPDNCIRGLHCRMCKSPTTVTDNNTICCSGIERFNVGIDIRTSDGRSSNGDNESTVTNYTSQGSPKTLDYIQDKPPGATVSFQDKRAFLKLQETRRNSFVKRSQRSSDSSCYCCSPSPPYPTAKPLGQISPYLSEHSPAYAHSVSQWRTPAPSVGRIAPSKLQDQRPLKPVSPKDITVLQNMDYSPCRPTSTPTPSLSPTAPSSPALSGLTVSAGTSFLDRIFQSQSSSPTSQPRYPKSLGPILNQPVHEIRFPKDMVPQKHSSLLTAPLASHSRPGTDLDDKFTIGEPTTCSVQHRNTLRHSSGSVISPSRSSSDLRFGVDEVKYEEDRHQHWDAVPGEAVEEAEPSAGPTSNFSHVSSHYCAEDVKEHRRPTIPEHDVSTLTKRLANLQLMDSLCPDSNFQEQPRQGIPRMDSAWSSQIQQLLIHLAEQADLEEKPAHPFIPSSCLVNRTSAATTNGTYRTPVGLYEQVLTDWIRRLDLISDSVYRDHPGLKREVGKIRWQYDITMRKHR